MSLAVLKYFDSEMTSVGVRGMIAIPADGQSQALRHGVDLVELRTNKRSYVFRCQDQIERDRSGYLRCSRATSCGRCHVYA